jgi:hypothetical protein
MFFAAALVRQREEDRAIEARMANPFRMFVALMCAIHVRLNGSVYLFIMAIDEVDSFVYDSKSGDGGEVA